MKKRIATILIVLVSLSSYGQVDVNSESGKQKLQEIISVMGNSKIAMEVDSEIYTINQGNSYFTADQKSAIIGMVAPSSYEKLKSDLNKQESNEEMEVIDRGELIEDGKKILFMKTKMVRGEETYLMYVYCKENDKDSSIMLTSYFEESKESKYIDIVKKAAFSAAVK